MELWLVLGMLVSSSLRPGYVIVQFKPEARAYLTQDHYTREAVPVPSLEPLFEEFEVQSLDRLIVDPHMPQEARNYGLDLIYLLHFNPQKDVFRLIEALQQDPLVQTAEPDRTKDFFYSPNDPSFTLQWALFRVMAPEAWDITPGSDTVILAIDDTGVDWDHEDLVGNMYQNLGEDADGDGHVLEYNGTAWVFDPGDVNGMDDDGNGRVDDFVGWDFYENNNDPSPAHNGPDYEHGTHVAGIASAATDNGVGIAGLGFRCKILGLRSYWLSNSVQAVYYAANMGADAFNMSWGGWTSSLNSAFQYAHARGVVLVGAAGNDNTSTPMYPAAHDLVIAVAATDQSDHKSDYSNYGTWIDIAAPGDAILSTTPDNTYNSFYGTSMAAPHVTGLVGLIRSLDPDLPPDSVKLLMQNTADPLTDDSYYNSGLLGAGRINAFRAVRTLAVHEYAMVRLVSVTFSDDGDADGRPDPGETVTVTLTVIDSADWQPAGNLQVTMRSLDPSLQVLDSTAVIGTVNPGETASNAGDPLVFVVQDTTPHIGALEFVYHSTPAAVRPTETYAFMVSQPYVLVVDDDGGSDYESYYLTALDSLHVAYDYWNVAEQGVPSLDGIYGLREHQVTLWFTGNETDPLSSEEQDRLMATLDAGKALLFSSQNAAEALSGSGFLANYLHAELVNGNSGDYFINGVAGDVVGDSLRLVVFGPGGANNATSPDVLQPTNGGIAFLEYQSAGGAAAVRYQGSYKVAFLGFPFEAINGDVTGFDSRETVLGRILWWMGVPVDVEEAVQVPIPRPRFALLTPVVRDQIVLRASLGAPSDVRVQLLDVAGRRVGSVHRYALSQGSHELRLPVTPLHGGVYFVELQDRKAGVREVFRVVVLR